MPEKDTKTFCLQRDRHRSKALSNEDKSGPQIFNLNMNGDMAEQTPTVNVKDIQSEPEEGKMELNVDPFSQSSISVEADLCTEAADV